MLADHAPQALVDNFVAQWLQLGKLAGVAPDADAYPEFDENLRVAMRQETRRSSGSQLREDRSVVEMITANYSYLNERLARHYGCPTCTAATSGGDVHRRRAGRPARTGKPAHGDVVPEPDVARAAREVAARDVLGAPPPPPPPDVPPLKEAGEDGSRVRSASGCRSIATIPCVRRATCAWIRSASRWRISTRWANGARRRRRAGRRLGIAARRDPIRRDRGSSSSVPSQKDDYVRTFSPKLLGYAIGRGIEADDQPAVRRIARERGRRASLVVADSCIVRSTPFPMSRREAVG